ncbi:MAG: NACHT domain-containing protein, partial [Leptolyngbyaceae cyanobacterium RU_5_1]|nr:NACHT domain-containing protein [Leptolyngbyaceae cyanobacterium RU_5_1]
ALKRTRRFEQCVALVSQVAYLESLQTLLNQASDILQRIADQPVSDAIAQQIKKLGDLELDDREARKAILYFHESKLATAFNEVLSARLQQAGLTASDAQNLCDRVARKTDEFMIPALAQAGDSVKRLVEWYQLGGRDALEKYLSLDEYLRDYISPDSTVPELKDRWRVFNEPFTLSEIYVPLAAQPIDRNGKSTNQRPIDLETWAKELLNNPEKKGRVLFIQGGPGRGKSAFCRMFAEWVRQHEHPRWTPILIRLRDVRNLEKDFEETLRKAVDRDFARSDDGWLTDRNTRFLFLLDGFDELLMEGRTSGGLEDFLDQVAKFQRSCQDNPEKGHRVLITGRTLSLHSIERRMPDNLERVEILLMNTALQEQWLTNWEQLTATETRVAFQQFLQDQRCPERIRGTDDEPGLAQEPLLLYLLAAIHRDGELTLEMFEDTEEVAAKISIYERSIDWVLTKQRPDWLNRDITELDTESLRCILAEAGLCVVQSGGECASLAMIEDRLQGNNNAKSLLEEARTRIKDNPLRNALAAFYLQPSSSSDGSVEFIHKSFGEFLFAERLKQALEDWSKPGDRRREFYISTEEMDWEIYDLLGYDRLTPEIVEYLMSLLNKTSEMDIDSWIRLFQRLEKFYSLWCEGKFIDAPPENLPQRKMRLLKEQIPRNFVLGLRQVDVYAGLNSMILLMELNYYARYSSELKNKITFYPFGQPDSENFDLEKLTKIINYSHSVDDKLFSSIMRYHLDESSFYSFTDENRFSTGSMGFLSENSKLAYISLSATIWGRDLRNWRWQTAIDKSEDSGYYIYSKNNQCGEEDNPIIQLNFQVKRAKFLGEEPS